jgi:hypothetical protein
MKTAYVLVSAAAIALAGGCDGPRNYYVEHLRVDRALNLDPAGDRSLTEPVDGSCYLVFHGATGLTSIEHFEKKPGSAVRERVFYLETFRSERVDRTVKDDEISRGPFGTLYAKKTCFYSTALESGSSGVSVGSYSNELGHEIPFELPAMPDVLPALTSLSLVRIFRADPEYVVVSGNYEASGELSSLHVDKSKGGDWVSGESRLHVNQNDLDLKKYGFPLRIDFERYLRLHRLTMPALPCRKSSAC